jgi:hypothetical protein
MTNTEIKNAWNVFKKEVQKETGLDLTGCCYMTAKQIANGTATITLQLDWSYDNEIANITRDIEYFSSWDGDNKERGERYARDYREKIAKIEAKKATYGTREREVKNDTERITNSVAFKKLADAIGLRSYALELGRYSSSMNIHQLRISY